MNSSDIRSLSKAILHTGIISEWHLNNMKTWAFAVFDGLDSVQIEFDIPTGMSEGDPIVEYKLMFKDSANKDNIELHASNLSSWTKQLLFSNMEVRIYDGERKVL